MAIADIRPALRSFLLEHSTLSAIVGGERIHPVVLPQGQVEPSIVFNRISAIGDHHMQGASGLAMIRMQLDAYAQTHDDANELADLIKEWIDGYRGLMGSVAVQGVFFDTEREDFQSEVNLYRVSRDYLIWYEER